MAEQQTVAAPDPTTPRCANCFAAAPRFYCALCGQKQTPPDLSARGLLREFVQELTNADGRLRRTTRSLLLQPGEFALDYFEGRRARHLPPIRTYLVTTLLLFVVIGSFATPLEIGPSERKNVRQLDAISVDTGHPEFDQLLTARLRTQIEHFIAAPQKLGQEVLDLAPQLGLIVLPIVALALLALFHTPGMRYGHHLIAALSLQCGAFLALIVGAALIGLTELARVANATFVAEALDWPLRALPWWIVVYVVLGLRRVYRRSWMSTVLRAFALALIYSIVTLASFGVAIVVAFLRF